MPVRLTPSYMCYLVPIINLQHFLYPFRNPFFFFKTYLSRKFELYIIVSSNHHWPPHKPPLLPTPKLPILFYPPSLFLPHPLVPQPHLPLPPPPYLYPLPTSTSTYTHLPIISSIPSPRHPLVYNLISLLSTLLTISPPSVPLSHQMSFTLMLEVSFLSFMIFFCFVLVILLTLFVLLKLGCPLRFLTLKSQYLQLWWYCCFC